MITAWKGDWIESWRREAKAHRQTGHLLNLTGVRVGLSKRGAEEQEASWAAAKGRS